MGTQVRPISHEVIINGGSSQFVQNIVFAPGPVGLPIDHRFIFTPESLGVPAQQGGTSPIEQTVRLRRLRFEIRQHGRQPLVHERIDGFIHAGIDQDQFPFEAAVFEKRKDRVEWIWGRIATIRVLHVRPLRNDARDRDTVQLFHQPRKILAQKFRLRLTFRTQAVLKEGQRAERDVGRHGPDGGEEFRLVSRPRGDHVFPCGRELFLALDPAALDILAVAHNNDDWCRCGIERLEIMQTRSILRMSRHSRQRKRRNAVRDSRPVYLMDNFHGLDSLVVESATGHISVQYNLRASTIRAASNLLVKSR